MKRAVTFLELLITIIIVGILVSFAIPNYYKAREHALGRAAIANLKLMDAAEEIYRLEIGTYYPSDGSKQGDLTEINKYLKLSISDDNWYYNITGSASAFNATADRENSGGYNDCQYSVAHNSTDGTPAPNSVNSCP